MISEKEIERVTEQSANFRQIIRDCRYDPQTDRIELVTLWCTLSVDRSHIAELSALSAHDMEKIYVSPTGIHIEAVDIDINSGGLIADLCKQLGKEAEDSF
jgi:hypothetical protein